MLVHFNCLDSSSIQSCVIKKNGNIKITTRFLSEKMLMFAKLPLMGCIYDLVEIFYFPNDTIQKIYKKYNIEKFKFITC